MGIPTQFRPILLDLWTLQQCDGMWISYFNDPKIRAFHQVLCACQNRTKTFPSHPHCPSFISITEYHPASIFESNLTVLQEPGTPSKADQILHNFRRAQMPRINSSTAGSLPLLSALFEQPVIWSAGYSKQFYLVCSITLLLHPNSYHYMLPVILSCIQLLPRQLT